MENKKEDQLALTGSFKNLKELSKKQLKDLKKKKF